MKKTKLYLILIFIYFFSTNVHSKKTEYIFISDDNFIPYSFIENGKIKGIDYDISQELAKRMGVKIKVKLFPWKRLLVMIKTGQCDGGFSLFKTIEREKYADFTDYAMHYSTYKVFVLKSKKFKFNKIEDLYDKKISKNFGFAISNKFDWAVKNNKIKIIEFEGATNLIRSITTNISDCFIGNDHVIRYNLKKSKSKKSIISLPKNLTKKRPAFLVVSKKSKNIKNKNAFILKSNTILKKMWNDNTINNIIKKYIK